MHGESTQSAASLSPPGPQKQALTLNLKNRTHKVSGLRNAKHYSALSLPIQARLLVPSLPGGAAATIADGFCLSCHASRSRTTLSRAVPQATGWSLAPIAFALLPRCAPPPAQALQRSKQDPEELIR
ncbi:hypothetical protein N7523_010284 [Penicillium sp. IBT 18751x]|nr:hypothetical protein N7523_010284 [Penicillium sp. IBT 18751x]